MSHERTNKCEDVKSPSENFQASLGADLWCTDVTEKPLTGHLKGFDCTKVQQGQNCKVLSLQRGSVRTGFQGSSFRKTAWGQYEARICFTYFTISAFMSCIVFVKHYLKGCSDIFSFTLAGVHHFLFIIWLRDQENVISQYDNNSAQPVTRSFDTLKN